MAHPARTFYDDLAESFHLIFQDWPQSIRWQASVLGPLIEREMPARPLRILDCACGIGTQTLGLAQRGHTLMGIDLSGAAISRAKREAGLRNLSIQFEVADMRSLSSIPETGFDVVVAADNALPHLLDDQDLARAVQQIAGKVRPGGLFLASIRDYDRLIVERPTVQGPAFYGCELDRRIVHQVWDWIAEDRYRLHMYITARQGQEWRARHFMGEYRALLRRELTGVLTETGFSGIRWLAPEESGFYQPMVMARRDRD